MKETNECWLMLADTKENDVELLCEPSSSRVQIEDPVNFVLNRMRLRADEFCTTQLESRTPKLNQNAIASHITIILDKPHFLSLTDFRIRITG